MVDMIVGQRPTHLITAELPPAAGQRALEHAIYRWTRKVNHRYIGRNWASPHLNDLRMHGVVVFETRGDILHGHLVVRPPVRASDFHFEIWAPAAYRWLTGSGKLHVERIKPAPEDLVRVANYVTKDLFWSRTTGEVWKFLEELTPRETAPIF